ncbi:BatA domain-containing protein [Daejeonella lutea]|uniref:VWA domain-containing protein n=1 Tax=Daejeonella lutea TaxID=572036 RepID=A0A1T5BYY3_9SPHI|nr:BatA domain-containing protein [Daejeonella lutea]SKB52384.1 hypothetical protein SAMN05661099_1725 [Daejeonella lutea]
MPLLLQLQFTSTSFLWLLGCLALGIGYAVLLYNSSSHLKKPVRNLLFALRTLAITIIAFLLFAPLVKNVNTSIEKPLIIIAQDNSASILVSKNKDFNDKLYVASLKKLESELSQDYDVRSFNFGSSVKNGLDVKFNGPVTDISSVFKLIEDQFSNRNIGALIIGSDGIYNRGQNPEYEARNVKSSIYTVAMGDTIAKRDLLISNVNYNNITYLDNQFQVEITVEGYQSQGSSSLLTVSDKGGVVFSRPIAVNSNEFRLTVPVTLLAKTKGIQQYNIRLGAISNELSIRNNSQTIFVEVIDGRQKVLILANSPHPDIAAVKQSVEINKNYSVKTAFASEVSKTDIDEAGLVILHQLPSVSANAQDIIKMVGKKPVLYILGAQSNVAAFSTSQPLLGITSTGNTQEVVASFEPDFYSFTLTDANKQRIRNFAPLISPFGNYGLKGPGNIMMSQQIGKVVTKMPLLVFGEENQRKMAVLAGEGIWRWRLEDFQESGNHEAIDELVGKTVQYLSTRDDKRKFRVYSSKNAFDENEHVILNAELYNNAFELVNTPDVNISLSSRSGKSYSFVFSRTTNAYNLDAGVLPAGEYGYNARTELGKDKYTAAGQFVITQQQAEFKQTRANHQLLYTLAQQSGGKMVFPSQLMDLARLIKANENVKTVSYEDRKYEEPINLKLVFFIILTLLSVEWFSRKRNGEV